MKWVPAVLALAAAFPAGAQSSAVPRAGETIEVSIVNVDVVVTDRHGNHIRGLKPDDFEIRDNGAVQPITNFAEYEDDRKPTAAEPTAEAPKLAAPQEKRTIVLFVERQTLFPAQADAFVADMKKLLHDTIRPGDTAAVVAFTYTTRLLQDFTGDLAKLDAAVDRLRPLFDRFGPDSNDEALRNEYLQEMLDRGTPGGTPSMIFNGTEGAMRQLVDIRRKAQTLNVLVNSMAGVDGRKAIFLATRRFGQYAGVEFSNRGFQPQDEEFNTERIREELTRNANAAGVTFYTIDPEGLVETPTVAADNRPMRFNSGRDLRVNSRANAILMNETASIGDLAKETGGTSGWGAGDIAKIAGTMSEDLSSYYSLAFRAPQKSATHEISVTTKNHSYVVRARRQFVEKDDLAQMSDRVMAALYQPQHAPSLQFDVEIGNIDASKHRYRIPIVIHIPAASLTALPDASGRSGAFRVYSVAGGKLGVNSDVFSKSQPFTIPANAKDADAKVFTYSFEMITDTRADRIAIGVYDELSKQSGVVKVSLTALMPTNP